MSGGGYGTGRDSAGHCGLLNDERPLITEVAF